jgi:DNA repair protein RadA/Sms
MWSDAVDSGPAPSARSGPPQANCPPGQVPNIAVILVGHVTKDGQIAGPARGRAHGGRRARLRRRAGLSPSASCAGPRTASAATDEIGVFEMADAGLREVVNPSALFLAKVGSAPRARRSSPASKGSRPVLVEFQALVAPSAYGTPRRAVVGWDSGRLAMVLAVLEARCGLGFGDRDVYLNVAGGLRITEPAADLAAAARWPPPPWTHLCRRTASSSARSACRARSARGPHGGAHEGGGQAGLQPRARAVSRFGRRGHPVSGVNRLGEAVGRIGDDRWT